MHNLFGASYFSGGDWTGRYFVVGSAVAVLLACLPFAFRLRDRYRAQPLSSRLSSNHWIGAMVRHPEQFMFFVPVLLLTLMLAIKMRAGMVTVAWGIEGVLIVLLALAVNERSYRLTGLSLLLLCVGKVLARDAWGLAPRDRYITFIILGAALLLVSFLYSKYRDAIRQFL
jgi:cation transporter-like permease